MTIIALERFSQVIDTNGRLTNRAAEFLEEITRQVNLSTIIEGSGSPEGVVIADPTKLYMDTTGADESVLYIKQSGTGDTGWKLV